ncbi:MAG: Protein of unknown function (DUF2283), partial [Candidatus Kentron sp. G]
SDPSSARQEPRPPGKAAFRIRLRLAALCPSWIASFESILSDLGRCALYPTDPQGPLERKITYYEEDDTLFIEFSKEKIVRDESIG